MKNNRLYHIWDQVPVDYYQQGIAKNIFQKIWHSVKISTAKKIASKLSFDEVLDVGCASGHMVSEIAKDWPKVKFYGIDIYDKAINFGKKKYLNISFQVAAAEKLPFRDKSFGLVLNFETIEHVQNPLKALLEIKRVLKDEGTAVVSMDSGSPLFRIVWFIWENTTGKVWQGAHLHPFKHLQLEDIIKEAGFKIKNKIFSHLGMEVTFVLGK